MKHSQKRIFMDIEKMTSDEFKAFCRSGNKNYGSIIFFVGLTLPRYRFSKPSASLDMNLR